MTDKIEIDNGIHIGISFEEYKRIDAVNSSSLKNMLVSPLNYKHILDNYCSTKSMDIGRAVHTSILESEKFDSIYSVYDGTRRGKAWEAFRDENSEKQILTISEFEKVGAIKESVFGHRRVAEILGECDNEVTIVFVEPVTGIRCKARIDSLSKACKYVADLKTTRDVEPGFFGRQSASLMYHFQYGFYRMALHTILGIWVPVKCIAVQNTAPFDAVVYNIPNDAVDKGMSLVIDCMNKLKECRENDKWPGIAEDEIDLEFPAWIYDYEEEEME